MLTTATWHPSPTWQHAPLIWQVATLKTFVSHLELSKLNLVSALRYYLGLFKLPGEAQIIDRILLAFAGQSHVSRVYRVYRVYRG